jgi:hypothetical protein
MTKTGFCLANPNFIPMITYEQARKLAEVDAYKRAPGLLEESISPLRDFVVVGEACWLFFLVREISWGGGEQFSPWDAYAVGHSGELRRIQNFDMDLEKLRIYAEVMSGYFSGVDRRVLYAKLEQSGLIA